MFPALSNAFFTSCGVSATAIKPDANGPPLASKPERFAQLLLGVRRPRSSPGGGSYVCSQGQDRKTNCMVNGARTRASRRIRGLRPHEPPIPAACCACRRTRKRRATEPAREVKRRRDEHLGRRNRPARTSLPAPFRSSPSPSFRKCCHSGFARHTDG